MRNSYVEQNRKPLKSLITTEQYDELSPLDKSRSRRIMNGLYMGPSPVTVDAPRLDNSPWYFTGGIEDIDLSSVKQQVMDKYTEEIIAHRLGAQDATNDANYEMSGIMNTMSDCYNYGYETPRATELRMEANAMRDAADYLEARRRELANKQDVTEKDLYGAWDDLIVTSL